MDVIQIPHDTNRLVLHFDTALLQINAYALASSLVGLANAIKEANSIVNPGYAVEVVVERLEDGSFRATLKAVVKKAGNIFSHELSKAIIYGIIATWIYDQTLGADKEPIIIINDESVEIRSGERIIIVPREVYDAKKEVERSERFQSSMSQVFNGALKDPAVTGLKITPPGEWPGLPSVPREQFVLIASRYEADDANAIYEDAVLEISRAIMSRGRRKWEFYWRGVKISAPVLDHAFYEAFSAHDITIAPGDMLRVVLKIYRKTDPESGIHVNTKYEVVEVQNHIPREVQGSFETSA
ncbi:hypothetical protein PDM28_16780 [Stenotrophomonas aracearum]|uniref:Baseplate protein J-like domain-containing protein n=1 Tax=Stenotrophomonas aracearum TaxID=3003272 RepID=A0ABY9YCE1_9GAMM|nr:hypothetical protein [Stenotrophomonas sp. A5588]WNH48301.1 hypothetical protein PDM28_16780 [Stenotrophomonas sp. A5588]